MIWKKKGGRAIQEKDGREECDDDSEWNGREKRKAEEKKRMMKGDDMDKEGRKGKAREEGEEYKRMMGVAGREE